ncbi:28655_t:CDS:1, partial [Racocetra persica]
YKDLILLTQDLEPIEDDGLDEICELADENKLYIDMLTEQDKQLNVETDKELAKALQEYKESDNNTTDNIILEEFNKP